MSLKRFAGLPACLVVAWTAFAATPPRPNILLIIADDLGYGELSCQGNPEIPTPHIDSIAKNGIRFTNGYVSGPYCSPTRAGLMTGRYQTRFGHEFNPGPAEQAVENFGLPLGETTLPQRLQAAGYATGMFGKWHLGYRTPFHPQRRGFDEFFGFLGGAHRYFDARADAANPILRGTTEVAEIDYTTEAFARETIAFIERQRERPWFAYLPFNAVHAPLEAPPKYEQRLAKIADPKRRTFGAMLVAMDDAIGAVLAKLAELKLEENTLVFFISDNGGPTAQITSGNGPLRGFKAQTWEGGIRVPWMVQWKGRLPAGRVDDRPVIQLDVLPTVLAAAGVESKSEWKLDGVNLLPFLDGRRSDAPHDALFWRFGEQVAVRRGDWKLVKGTGSEGVTAGRGRGSIAGAELYQLKDDVGETKNLAAANPEKVRELAALWTQWDAGNVDPKWHPERAGGAGKKKKAKKE